MNKETLIKNLKEINQNLTGEDQTDGAMYNIVDALNDYQQETKNESWHSTMESFLTIEQVKDEVIKELQTSKELTPDLLHKVANQLSSYNHHTVWCQKFGNQYFSICKQTVKHLIAQLLKQLEPQTYEAYKRQTVEKLKGINIDDYDDLDQKYEQINSICEEWYDKTGDYTLMDFFETNFIPLKDVREELQDLFDYTTSCPDDLQEIQRRMKLGTFASIYYQKFADNTYIDLNEEGLQWCKECLLRRLGEEDDKKE